MPSSLYETPAVLHKFVISNLGTEIAAVFAEEIPKNFHMITVHTPE